LTHVDGLSGLKSVGLDLVILRNDALTSLEGPTRTGSMDSRVITG
jgi:hypothetical protein